MKKIVFALFVTLILVGCGAPQEVQKSVVGNAATAPTEEVDSENTVPLQVNEFTFTGYAGPKSHAGTFNDISAEATVEDGEIQTAVVTVQADSVDTGIDGLDSHLKNEDFFHVEEYPEMTFTLVELTDTQARGTLDFHGVEREITFPITREGDSLTTDFLLDTEPFNLKYTGVDNEVRIQFDVSLNQ